MSILDFFPVGKKPRPAQVEILLAVERNWYLHNVLVLRMPPGSGKTEVALCIANWRADHGETNNYIQPTNALVDQTLRRYPHLQALHKQDAEQYRCAEMDMLCSRVKETCGKLCKGCVYTKAKRAAKQAPVRVMNTYVYWAQRLYAQNALFDEGHQLIDMLADKRDIRLYQSSYHFPTSLRTVADVIEWAQEYLRDTPDPKLHRALVQIMKVRHGAVVVYKTLRSKGKSTVVLHVVPTTLRDVPPWLWPPDKVKKIVLLSATIGPQDIEELGLSGRKVAYLDCASPIPPDRRPVIYDRRVNMGHKYVDLAMPIFASLVREVLKKHPEKGLIHLPYGLAARLRDLVTDPRLLWHDHDNKLRVLDEFKESTPELGKVLVASGLYEGVDLPYDAARWQIIGKVPYLSLADPAVAEKAEKYPLWYAWETIKRVLQASGRIVRGADDFGCTYLFDANFGRLLREDDERPPEQRLFPQYFREAIKKVQGY